MLARRYGVALGIAVALTVLPAMTARSAPAADEGPETTSDASKVWLTLDWTGSLPPIGQHLSVDAEGKVRLRSESQESDRLIGLYGFTLSPERLAQLRQAVAKANLPALDGVYPLGDDQTEVEWVTIRLDDPELGHKQAKVSNRSRYYPAAIRSLFSLGPYEPKGVLGELSHEAAQHPICAIRLSVDAPSRRFRKGEPINVTLIVTNVGTQPVVVPSLECKRIVRGRLAVYLQDAQYFAVGGDYVTEFGWSGESPPGRFDDRAKADLAHVVRLAPGEQWRIALPKPLIAPDEVGLYEVRASLWMFRQYDLPVLTEALGEGFVSGYLFAEPGHVIVPQ
jgi:hypothetical protein